MKFAKYLLISLTTILIISACQKELDFEIDGLAHGTLSNSAGDCLPSIINGIYKADSLLSNSNFVDVQVNLTATGTYDIKSDTLNGYSFRGTGTLGIIGLNTVRLYATGKPLVAGTDFFTIRFDSSSVCNISITVIGASVGAAVFTLGGSPGICSGATINGIYTAGTALGINNTVSVVVNVSTAGIYVLAAVSVNGMLFSSTGVFLNTGVQSVTLNGSGTPAASGDFNVTVTNLTDTCTFSVTVLPAASGPAVFTMTGDPGACTGATSAGIYTAGTALTATNTMILNVNVQTVGVGTYAISSNIVNGISFSATGTFTVTGVQPVTLIGTGTPTAAGVFNHSVTGNASTCTFSVTVTSVLPPANLDYIPETAFSNWTDKLVGGLASDTAYVQVSPNSIVRNGTTYKIFEGKDMGVPTDSALHRKNGGLYYQLFDQAYGFDNAFNAEGLLLDSSLAVNATWNINLGNNLVNGIAATGKINVLITGKNATATIAGNAYTNIIKVTYTYNYNTGTTDTPYAVEEIWYARGKGVVYYKVNDLPVTFTDVYETTRTQIF